jgi:hypothetical protein
MSSGLVVVMVGSVRRVKGSFPGRCYLMEGLSSLVPSYEILHIINDFLPGGAYPLAVSWCYLGVFLRHNNVGWRWDGFHTRVCSARFMWVPTATSHRGRCFRLTSPEAQNGQFLSITGSPRHVEARVPFLGCWVKRMGGENPVCPCLIICWRSDDVVCYFD